MFGIGVDPQGDSPVVLAKLAAHIAERATADSAGRLLRDADAATAAEADALSAEIAAHGALTFFAGSGCAQALGARGVCAAGEVLRRWLFALPEPLLSFSMYDSFLLADTVADAGDRVLVLRTLLAHLARGYRAATRGLLALLSRLCDVSSAAATTPEALSAALWPVLLRPAEACFYMRDDEPAARRVVAALVAEGDGLWKTVSVGAGHRLVSRQKPSDPGLPFPPFFSSDGGSTLPQLPQQQQHPMPALQVVMVADDPVCAPPPAVVAASPARPKMQRPDSRQKLKLSAQRSRVASTAATAGFPVATAAAAAAGLFAVGSPGGAPSSVLRTPSGDFRLALSSEQTPYPSSAAAASVPGRLAPIVTHSDTFVEASGAPSSVVP